MSIGDLDVDGKDQRQVGKQDDGMLDVGSAADSHSKSKTIQSST